MAKSEVREQATLTPPEKKPPRFGLVADGTSSPAGLIIKIAVLAVVLGIAVWAALPLLADQRWVGLAIVVLITALLFYIYLSPRRVPAKYLIPGTLFLIVFQIVPVLYTMSTAFTNFGDWPLACAMVSTASEHSTGLGSVGSGVGSIAHVFMSAYFPGWPRPRTKTEYDVVPEFVGSGLGSANVAPSWSVALRSIT